MAGASIETIFAGAARWLRNPLKALALHSLISRSGAGIMSGVLFPRTSTSAESPSTAYSHLLSELRFSLDAEGQDDESRRWLLAVADKLLALGFADLLALERRNSPPPPKFLDSLSASLTDPTQFLQKIQRLRDRLAHRTPFAMLANEIRVDLQRLLTPHPERSSEQLLEGVPGPG